MGRVIEQIITSLYESGTIVTGTEMDTNEVISGLLDRVQPTSINGVEVCPNTVIKNYLNN